MNTRRTPARIVAAQHPNQISNLLRHLGATRLATADSLRPKQAETLPMPRDHSPDRVAFLTASPRWSRPRPSYASKPRPAVLIHADQNSLSWPPRAMSLENDLVMPETQIKPWSSD